MNTISKINVLGVHGLPRLIIKKRGSNSYVYVSHVSNKKCKNNENIYN